MKPGGFSESFLVRGDRKVEREPHVSGEYKTANVL